MKKRLHILCGALLAMSAVFGAEVPEVGTSAANVRKSGKTATITLPGGAKMEMIWCAPGKFKMGSPVGEKGRVSNETLHRCAYRLKREPNLRNCIFGLRLACSDCDAVCSSTVSRPK